MFRVIRMQNDGNASTELFDTFRDAYHSCVPEDMQNWHLKMYAPTMQELNVIGARPVVVSYNEDQNLLIAYWIEVIVAGHMAFPALVMPQAVNRENQVNENNRLNQVNENNRLNELNYQN